MGRKAGIRTEYTIKRDEEILQLLSAGLNYDEIADRICVAPQTVADLVYRMRKEWKAKNNCQLVAMYATEKLTA